MGKELVLEVIDVLKMHSAKEETPEAGPMSITDIWRRLVMRHHHINLSEIGDRKQYHDPSYDMVRDAVNAIKAAELDLPDGQKTIRYSGEGSYARYWYAHALSDAEAKFLIDASLSSPLLGRKQAEQLADKIQNSSNRRVSDMTSYAHVYGSARSQSSAVFKNIERIYRAMGKRKLRFSLNVYGTDKKLHKQDRIYLVSPYRLVMVNGKYYLLAGFDGSDEVYFFRVDLMSDLRITKEFANKPDGNTLVGNTFRYADFQLEHPHMMGGEIKNFSLRVDTEHFTQIVDSFGTSVRVIAVDEAEKTAEISVRATESAMYFWLLQYCEIAEVLNPTPQLREKLLKSAKRLQKLYVRN